MSEKFTDVDFPAMIQSKYVKGEGYEDYRRVRPHEVMMSFNCDSAKEAFMAWWDEQGSELFASFEKDFKPTYKYQTAVIAEEIRNSR
jgi:hypothetical protein